LSPTLTGTLLLADAMQRLWASVVEVAKPGEEEAAGRTRGKGSSSRRRLAGRLRHTERVERRRQRRSTRIGKWRILDGCHHRWQPRDVVLLPNTLLLAVTSSSLLMFIAHCSLLPHPVHLRPSHIPLLFPYPYFSPPLPYLTPFFLPYLIRTLPFHLAHLLSRPLPFAYTRLQRELAVSPFASLHGCKESSLLSLFVLFLPEAAAPVPSPSAVLLPDSIERVSSYIGHRDRVLKR
jgi:hypothetical protein